MPNVVDFMVSLTIKLTDLCLGSAQKLIFFLVLHDKDLIALLQPNNGFRYKSIQFIDTYASVTSFCAYSLNFFVTNLLTVPAALS